MKMLWLAYKWLAFVALTLFGALIFSMAAPVYVIQQLFFFVAFSMIPLALLLSARSSLRTAAFHLILVVLTSLVGGAILGGSPTRSMLVLLTALLPGMAVMVDLVFNDEIGRPPRQRFLSLVKRGKLEIAASLILLITLGIFSDAIERFGILWFSVILVTLVWMLYSISTAERLRDPMRAMAPLLVGGAWNIAVYTHAKYLVHYGWSATALLGFGCLNTAYKLGRCPIPDDWETVVEVKRPTQALKRTAGA